MAAASSTTKLPMGEAGEAAGGGGTLAAPPPPSMERDAALERTSAPSPAAIDAQRPFAASGSLAAVTPALEDDAGRGVGAKPRGRLPRPRTLAAALAVDALELEGPAVAKDAEASPPRPPSWRNCWGWSWRDFWLSTGAGIIIVVAYLVRGPPAAGEPAAGAAVVACREQGGAEGLGVEGNQRTSWMIGMWVLLTQAYWLCHHAL